MRVSLSIARSSLTSVPATEQKPYRFSRAYGFHSSAAFAFSISEVVAVVLQVQRSFSNYSPHFTSPFEADCKIQTRSGILL